MAQGCIVPSYPVQRPDHPPQPILPHLPTRLNPSLQPSLACPACACPHPATRPLHSSLGPGRVGSSRMWPRAAANHRSPRCFFSLQSSSPLRPLPFGPLPFGPLPPQPSPHSLSEDAFVAEQAARERGHGRCGPRRRRPGKGLLPRDLRRLVEEPLDPVRGKAGVWRVQGKRQRQRAGERTDKESGNEGRKKREIRTMNARTARWASWVLRIGICHAPPPLPCARLLPFLPFSLLSPVSPSRSVLALARARARLCSVQRPAANLPQQFCHRPAPPPLSPRPSALSV